MLKYGNITYDPDTGEFYRNNSLLNTVDKDGYRTVTVGKRRYRGHRLAWYLLYGSWPINNIDHKNRNKLDNRSCNLRQSTYFENNINVGVKSSNTSGVPGVCWDKQKDKWIVQIRVIGKRFYLGHYDDLDLAELVITEARSKYHKEFNWMNSY